ncbi:MAG: hypothetical protein ISR58_21860 [Anaerolineales bacterium]|nr:hypothetical protein [Chloroflexota bacterium]MBL6983839.1 hypothetical protein [Anaerolineales bacterium]
MDHFKSIYTTRAANYHELIAAEDVDGNLLRELERSEIRTDYQFKNIADAIQKTEFFFGPELSEVIRRNSWSRLPEWTGLWHKETEK